jgi:RNA polymerase sigma factor (sigma-70 family)
MERDTELRLVAGLRAGDTAAFDEVHAAFNARLFRFLCLASNRRDVAEDLLEETWLRLVVHAQKLRADTHLSAWLFTVARNLHTSYCRSRLLDHAYAEQLIGLWPSGAPSPSPLAALESSEAEGRLAAALASLPIAQREALLLVGVEGLRPAEAAEVCGVSAEVLRQRLSRARRALADHLRERQRLGVAGLKAIVT